MDRSAGSGSAHAAQRGCAGREARHAGLADLLLRASCGRRRTGWQSRAGAAGIGEGGSRRSNTVSIYSPDLVPTTDFSMTTTSRPPTLDPHAVSRWQRTAPLASPWLHEEVASRMQDRLQWIKLKPQAWAHWGAVARRPAGACPVGQNAIRMQHVLLPKPGGAGAGSYQKHSKTVVEPEPVARPRPCVSRCRRRPASTCCGPTWRCTRRPIRRRCWPSGIRP